MSKYDYGYELVPGTTTFWAFQKIQPESRILELGPAIGNLAKHLSEEKNCVVDIIEIDEESGKKAMQFARKGFLGMEEGNLEKDFWYEQLKMAGDAYDYIVILDVLEHIRNAEDVLRKLGTLLKEDGEILISMPNVAHNSVIINLLNNRFIYTADGLLDDTHVRFYTYRTFKNLLQKSGLKAVKKEMVQIPVGMNEIVCGYQDIPADVEKFLRTRPGADVYQFLFTIQKESSSLPEAEFEYQALDETLYKMQVYLDGKAENKTDLFVDPQNIEYTVKIPDGGQYKFLRIDPVEFQSVIWVKSVEIKTDGIWQDKTEAIKTNGYALGKRVFCFLKDDPNVFIDLPQNAQEVHFICKCFDISSESLEKYVPVIKKETTAEKELEKYQFLQEKFLESMENFNRSIAEKTGIIQEQLEENQKLICENGKAQRDNQELKEKSQALKKETEELKKEIQELVKESEKDRDELEKQRQEIDALNKELTELKNVWMNKVYLKIKGKK